MTQLVYPDWKEKVTFSADGPQPQPLVETGGFKAVLVGLEAGLKIPTHPAPTAVYHFLEGTGWMTVGDQRYAIAPGATIVAPDGVERGVEAVTRLAFLGAHGAGS